MSEVSREAKVFLVNYECDSCKSGMMKPTGEARQLGFEARFSHKCGNCGNVAELIRQYPYPEYVEVLS